MHHEKNYASALAFLKRALKLGHAGAAHLLGTIYSQGLGVPKNDEIALAYFEFSAKKDHAASMLNAAILKGRCAQSDTDLCIAKEWLRKASDQGVGAIISRKKLDAYFQVIEGLRSLKLIRSCLRSDPNEE